MDEALDKAIRVFREQGYYATSIGALGAAMGLTSGSIYKAFADKRAVFVAALGRYTSARNAQLRRTAATAKPGRERLRDVLGFYVESAQGVEGRRGCLIVGTATQLATFDAEIAAQVADALRKNQGFLAELIRQGQADGSIGSHVDADATARVIACMTQGLRVIGKTGRTRAELADFVEIALKLLA